MRTNSWLQSSGSPREVQSAIQDLPFDMINLFCEKTDKSLPTLKDNSSLSSHLYPSLQEKMSQTGIGWECLLNSFIISVLRNHHVKDRGFIGREIQPRQHPSPHLTRILRQGVSFDGTVETRILLLMPYYFLPQVFGGHLMQFACNWRARTMNRWWILEIISGGYLIEFLATPTHRLLCFF